MSTPDSTKNTATPPSMRAKNTPARLGALAPPANDTCVMNTASAARARSPSKQGNRGSTAVGAAGRSVSAIPEEYGPGYEGMPDLGLAECAKGSPSIDRSPVNARRIAPDREEWS